MKDADRGQPKDLDGKGLDIGIVCTRFNAAVVDAMLAACEDELKTLGVSPRSIEVVRVPGALEVPLALKVLAERDDFDALIALGCVIRGETYHFELVADQSGAGVMRVSLDHQIPIANAILTVENDDQARARVDEKSRDAARVAVEMANLMDELT